MGTLDGLGQIGEGSMKKRNLIFILLVLTGCSSVEGYIVDKEDGRILIVNPESVTYGESKNPMSIMMRFGYLQMIRTMNWDKK